MSVVTRHGETMRQASQHSTLIILAITLSACAGEANPPAATNANAAADSASATTQLATAAPEALAPKPPATSDDDAATAAPEPQPGYLTAEQWRGLSVFGLTLDMPEEEAVAALLEQGFALPNEREPGNPRGPFGTVKPGQSDRRAEPFTRGRYNTGTGIRPLEQITPFFYHDQNLERRLLQVRYKRRFQEDTYVRQIKPKMLERYGEPTVRESDTDIAMKYQYVADLEPPMTFHVEPAPELPAELQGSSTEAIYERVMAKRSGKYRAPTPETRNKCLNKLVKDVDAEPSKRCTQLLSFDFDAAPLYFSNLKPPVVLDIEMNAPGSFQGPQNTLEIRLGAPLDRIAKSRAGQLALTERIAAIKAQAGDDVAGLDGL